jgi:large subunit ribosomal protein L17
MRHRKIGIKLNRTSSHRNAMFRNMVTSLFKYNRIKTTDVKAKELRRWADKLITLAKRGDLHARRQALSIVREKAVVYKLFDEATEKYGAVNGGYTRIVKIGRRPGDAAHVSLIELISKETGKGKKKTEKGKEKTVDKVVPVKKKEEIKTEPVLETVTENEVEVVEENEPVVQEPQEELAEDEKPGKEDES